MGIGAVIANTLQGYFIEMPLILGYLFRSSWISEVLEEGEIIDIDMEKGIIISKMGKFMNLRNYTPFILEILKVMD